jgi:UPF0755 protein
MKKVIIAVGMLVIMAGALAGAILYKKILSANVSVTGDRIEYLYIRTGDAFPDVLRSLSENDLLIDTASFRWVALRKNYPRHVYPGRYRIPSGCNNNRLVNILRSGQQEPVRLVFNNIRSREKLASVISAQIEADSLEILDLFHNEDQLKEYGLTRETVMGVFIPNTYEIYWNTSAGDFLERMVREYRIFWNDDRTAQAARIGLEPMEVVTLASIVDEETLLAEEEPRIAGVYMNRLERRIRLHADPTVKYAVGDMGITRVLQKHLEVDSPYNTYRHGGLPPGPIVVPSISAIEAVLQYERHNYLYFCAREDFSGYHNFASTLAQHNRNARLYQKALDERKILN